VIVGSVKESACFRNIKKIIGDEVSVHSLTGLIFFGFTASLEKWIGIEN